MANALIRPATEDQKLVFPERQWRMIVGELDFKDAGCEGLDDLAAEQSLAGEIGGEQLNSAVMQHPLD